jgi:hypothetical protein
LPFSLRRGRRFGGRCLVAAITVVMQLARVAAMEEPGAAAFRAGSFARDLLLDLVADHPRAGDLFRLRHAHANRAGRLDRDLLLHADRVLLGLLLGDALADRLHALLFFPFGLANVHLAGDRLHLANALLAAHRVLFPGRAGHPAALGLGARARLAAGILAAAVPVQTLLELVKAARAALDLLALPVTLIHALANDLVLRDIVVAGLVGGACLDARDLHAHAMNDFLGLRHRVVNGADAGSLFLNVLAAVGGVVFLPLLLDIDGTGCLIFFGHPLFDANGAVLRGARLTTIVGSGGNGRRGYDNASQQDYANMLPDHDISFVAILADPGRPRDHSAGQDRTTIAVERTATMPKLGVMEKETRLGIPEKSPKDIRL